jgi:hypothetical protein
MGFLGGISNIVSQGFKTLAPIAKIAMKAIQPAVTEKLQSLVSGFIDGGSKALGTAAKGLLGPLVGGLAEKLLGKGAEALKGLTDKGISALLEKLMGASRQVPGAPAGTPEVTLPQIGTQERASGVAAATAAATTAIANASGNTGNVNIANRGGGTIEDKAAAALGALTEPPFPGKDATEAELAQFQKDLGKYNRMYEMMSKIMANSHEMKKNVIGNFPR